jgi:ribosome-associated protein
MITIDDELEIPDSELDFRFARSSGPGGQNVNKVETRVTLLFDVEASPSLTDEQRDRIRERLATRINRQGVLRVTSQRHRTQAANQNAAIVRFAELLAEALRETTPRKPTRTPARIHRKRLERKRKRGEKKRLRKPPRIEE